ncbi:MAG: glycosyltransferase [Micrococcaceae bacterium]
MKNDEFGIVVMACYKPNEKLFAQQLKSIQQQTHENFECLLSSDGSPEEVKKLVDRYCPNDSRFKVIGFEQRLGFPQNFERGILSAPSSAQWIALSDQDDFWYPEKLAELIPLLNNYSLVSGQANVVPEAEAGIVLGPGERTTERRVTTPLSLLAQNQITGSFSVLNPKVLDIALPIPTMNSQVIYHDQWFALCALALDGIYILDKPLQNYVQHESNFVGESRNGFLGGVGNTIDKWKKKFPDAQHLPSLVKKGAQDLADSGVGIREVMVATLAQRLEEKGIPVKPEIQQLFDVYLADNSKNKIVKSLYSSVKNKEVTPQRGIELISGLPFVKPQKYVSARNKTEKSAVPSGIKNVAAVVACFNPDEGLKTLVQALLDAAVDVYLVNDGGTSFAQEYQDLPTDKVFILDNKTNKGIAHVLNQGIKEAQKHQKYDAFFTFDQDSLIPEEFVASMVKTLNNAYEKGNSKVGMVIPTSYARVANKTFEDEYGCNCINNEPIQSGLLIPQTTFEDLGYFEEAYFIDMVDTEFYLRCKSKGYACLVANDAHLEHKLGKRYTPQIFGKERYLNGKLVQVWFHDPYRQYYIVRNRILLRKKYAKEFPQWFAKNLQAELKQNLIIMSLGPNKKKTLLAVRRGIKDGLNNVTGKVPDDLRVALDTNS